MNCPKCQTVNRNSVTYCFKCGFHFSDRATNVSTNEYVSVELPDPRQETGYRLNTGLATMSVIIGVIGIFTFGILVVGALAGIVIGIIALNNANRDPYTYGGKRRAVAGIIVNIVAVIITPVIGIVAAIAIPSLLSARQAANESSAIRNLRTLSRAEEIYMRQNGKAGNVPELVSAKLVDRWWMTKHMDGYSFDVRVNRDGFEAFARQENYGASGHRSFYISSENWEIIHAADKHGADSNVNDPVLGLPSTHRIDPN